MLSLNSQVSLVPIEPSHADAMFRWMSRPDLAADVGLRQTASLEKTRAWIERARADATMRPFAILAEGRHVGNVVLDQVDRYLDTARLSVYIGEPEFQGRGIGRTAVYLALEAGFTEAGLHKVWLTVHVRNHAALRSYAGLGFAVEGILRGEFQLDGRRIDAFRMSLMRAEFLDLKVAWKH